MIDNKALNQPVVAGDSRGLLATWLKCGLAVGVSDFLFASVSNGLMLQRSPVRVFQGVASVVFGRGALDGGLPTAALGLAMHFGVALFWAAGDGRKLGSNELRAAD